MLMRLVGLTTIRAKLLTPIFASDIDLDTTVYWYGKWSVLLEWRGSDHRRIIEIWR